MDDSKGGRWLVVEEAAKTLGISPDGVRKRVKRGHLEAQRGNDGLIRVLVMSDTVLDEDETVLDRLRHVADGLRRELDAARADAARWRQTAEERGMALAQAETEARVLREAWEREKARADELPAGHRQVNEPDVELAS